MSETLKATRSYMDQNFESQSVTEEGTFEAFKTQDEALQKISNDQMLEVLNAGYRQVVLSELGKKAEAKFPADAIDEKAYSAVFDAFRPRLEAKGIDKIAELRNAFRDLAKGNPKVKAQILAMQDALRVEI